MTREGWTYCPQCGMDVPTPIYLEFCIITPPKEEDK